MKKVILILSLSLYAASAHANHPQGTIKVSIYGLVCDFCARALEKVFLKEDAVDDINVDLDAKVVTIHLNHNRDINDATVRQHIIDAGYNVEEINRGS